MRATAETPGPSSSQPPCRFVDNLQGKRLPCLDGIRGIAAYMVVVVHTEMFYLYNLGPFAVNVFFVISGFLITLLLIGEAERHSGDVSLKKFYIRRTLRIFPAFYISWAFTLAVGLLLHKPFGRMEPVATFFYLGDYYHALFGRQDALMLLAWSLGVEEKFYLLWPAVFVMLLGRWSTLFKCCLGAMALIWLHKLVLLYVFHVPLSLLRICLRHARRHDPGGLRAGAGNAASGSQALVQPASPAGPGGSWARWRCWCRP